MQLTARGWTALAVAGLAIGLAVLFGQRSLNAVAAPLLGAVGYGAVSLWRTDPPTVRCSDLAPGYPGETRTVSLTVAGRGVAHLRHRWPDGLDGRSVDTIVSPPATIETEVTLAGRGVHDLGAISAWRRDPLGLVESYSSVSTDASVVVYPQVYRAAGGDGLSTLLADEHRVERQAFDTLREYRPGDPLRRIHWKSSAKHDEFLVTEFASDRRTQTLSIAAEAEPGAADDMATAVGTVALQALRAGLDVAVTLPDESVPAGSGDAHRANLLGVLARVDFGTLPSHVHAEADVSVRAERATTTLASAGRARTLAELVSGPSTRPVQEVAPA